MNADPPPIKETWITLGIVWVLCLIPFPFTGLAGLAVNIAAFVMAIIVMSKGGTFIGIVQLLCTIIISPTIYFIGLALFAMMASDVAVDSIQNSIQNNNLKINTTHSFKYGKNSPTQNTIMLKPIPKDNGQ